VWLVTNHGALMSKPLWIRLEVTNDSSPRGLQESTVHPHTEGRLTAETPRRLWDSWRSPTPSVLKGSSTVTGGFRPPQRMSPQKHPPETSSRSETIHFKKYISPTQQYGVGRNTRNHADRRERCSVVHRWQWNAAYVAGGAGVVVDAYALPTVTGNPDLQVLWRDRALIHFLAGTLGVMGTMTRAAKATLDS
jgi:hypothetical protein